MKKIKSWLQSLQGIARMILISISLIFVTGLLIVGIQFGISFVQNYIKTATTKATDATSKSATPASTEDKCTSINKIISSNYQSAYKEDSDGVAKWLQDNPKTPDSTWNDNYQATIKSYNDKLSDTYTSLSSTLAQVDCTPNFEQTPIVAQ
jgi:hypothetical protein